MKNSAGKPETNETELQCGFLHDDLSETLKINLRSQNKWSHGGKFPNTSPRT